MVVMVVVVVVVVVVDCWCVVWRQCVANGDCSEGLSVQQYLPSRHPTA
jgi:hypothetical protein